MKPGLALLALMLAACAPRPPLPVLGQVPPFELTDQNGRRFDRAQVMGHVWVADFMYTTCTGPCPLMSAKMRRLQNRLGADSDVRLLSFTVDPRRDTPPVLAAYAVRYQARPGRWYFLTGAEAELNALARGGFKLNNVDGVNLDHSTRFVLVDRAARIRGYYLSSEADVLDRLVRGVRRLEQERP